MKIFMEDIPYIVRELMHISMCGNREILTELKILDYAICGAIEQDKSVAEVIRVVERSFYNTGKMEEFFERLDYIANRTQVLSDDELLKLYRDLRCITGIRCGNERILYTNEVGFSQELCERLESFEHMSLMINVYNNLTEEKLRKLTDNNQTLIDEFNNKMSELGFTWIEDVGEKRLDYEYSYSNMKDNPNYIVKSQYVEMVEKFLESRKNNPQVASEVKVEIKKVTQPIPYNPVLEKPFTSQAFKALPAEFQEWMKKGYVQEVSQQSPEFKIDRAGRIISQMVERGQEVEQKQVEVKDKPIKKKSIKKETVFKLIQNDLNMIYDLDDKFIIKNQEDIWECILVGEGDAKTKRELLRHIDNICNQKQVLN